jgi:hypothetical protein
MTSVDDLTFDLVHDDEIQAAFELEKECEFIFPLRRA